jgi:hypothetical protein
VRWIGLVVGAVLMAAAVATVVSRRDIIAMNLAAIRQPGAWEVFLLLGTVIANVVLTGLMFSVLMSRYGRVGVVEMQALIAAAALANYLPLRPGLFGRVAYHKAFNKIPITATMTVTLTALGLSVAIGVYMAMALFAAGRASIPLWVVVGAPLPVLAAATALRASRIVGTAALIRYIEVLLLAVRYQAAFALIGAPIDPAMALAFACVSLVVTMIPLSGNGLGLREWAVGLASPMLTPYVLEVGMTADLVNRAAEAVVVVILGLSAFAWLAWHRRSTAVT